MTLRSSPPSRRLRLALLVDYYGGEYQMGLIEAAQRATRRLGYDLLVVVGRSLGAPEPHNLAQNDIYTHLGPSTVDGIAVGSGCIGIYESPEALAAFCARYGSIPLASISTQLPNVPSLVVNNRRGMQLPLHHLIEEHGCREQFGLERLITLLEQYRSESPDVLCDRVLDAAAQWGVEQIDDMTLLVARYLGDPAPAPEH